MKFGLLLFPQDPPDARNLPAVYDQVLEQAQVAEEYGFDSCFVPEHHQMPDGYLPSPLTFCAAIAARTSKINVGTSIMQLPMWHPVHVAEDGAVVDNLSKGRLILGVALGIIEKEFAAYGISVKDGVSRFEESIEIIQRAWTEASFSFSGRHFQLDNVSITPKPVRKPRPPIWIGAQSDKALFRAGRLGDGWISDPLHIMQVMQRAAKIYRRGAREHSNTEKVILMRDAWVSDSRREIEDVWWPHVKADHIFYLNLGYFSSGRFNSDWEPWIREARSESEWTYERVAPNRLIAGNHDEVIKEVERYQREIGCNYMIMIFRRPTGPDHSTTVECIKRFGKYAIPHFSS